MYASEKMVLNDLEIEYVDIGNNEKDTLIFAHGLGGNWRQWLHQIQYFEKEYRVIAFSLQGHGMSTKPLDPCFYSIQSYAKVVARLLKELSVKSCKWIGNSMGGVIGYELIETHPTLISHLVTNGTAPALKYSKTALKLIKLMDQTLIKVLGYKTYINIAVNASLDKKDHKAQLRALFMNAHPKAIVWSHQLLGYYDYLNAIRHTSTKVSFLLTPNDKDVNKAIRPFRAQLEANPHVTFHDLNEGGHVVNIELADLYNQTLKAILCQN